MLHKIEAWRKEKQDRLEEARNLREYEELLDCTFTPSIAPAAPPPKVQAHIFPRNERDQWLVKMSTLISMIWQN